MIFRWTPNNDLLRRDEIFNDKPEDTTLKPDLCQVDQKKLNMWCNMEISNHDCGRMFVFNVGEYTGYPVVNECLTWEEGNVETYSYMKCSCVASQLL